LTILNAISPPEALAGWDDFVATHPFGHLLQTTGWGRLKAEVGWDWEVVLSGTPEAPQAGAVGDGGLRAARTGRRLGG